MLEGFAGFHCSVDEYDPSVNKDETQQEHNIQPIEELPQGAIDGIVLLKGHVEFQSLEKLKSFAPVKSEAYNFPP